MQAHEFDSDLADRMSRARIRYTLESAHNRRRFERDGIVIAIGDREPRILPLDSRLPIVVRAAFHPDARRPLDAIEQAWAVFLPWLCERACAADRWVWSARGKRFFKRIALLAVGSIALVAFLHRI